MMRMIYTGCLNCLMYNFSFPLVHHLLTIILICSCHLAVFAQRKATDAVEKPAKEKSSFKPNPRKAVLFAIIPGGGQIYNRSYWKVPIVYAATGGMLYLTIQNRNTYLEFKDAYIKELAGEPHPYKGINPNVILNARNTSRKTYEQSYLFLSIVYLIQIAEAYVDAHLQDYDISDDISFRLKPGCIVTPFGLSPALTASFRRSHPKTLSVTFQP